ncbi:MAG: ATP-binding protein [Bdellovibrio sp. 28-41-41]|nr:MAG: ATP-binding protein [Bdellovibrio sp. 28-41-41]
MMIQCRGLVKEFGVPPHRVLHALDIDIQNGEFVSISGKSGSGKSTLLYIISTLDLPSMGTVEIDGKNIAKMTSDEVHAFRNHKVGFIFQFHYLLPELTAIENILLPARNLNCMDEKMSTAKELLERLGVSNKENSYPAQMSGGEQQRIAIARALILSPKYIFADEPTGNLDTENAEIVMNLLKQVNATGTTVCLVTHDPDFAAMASREIYLKDGRLASAK